MIDTHCHLLPGIDDGPADLERALTMARVAVEDGITVSIVTPHMREGLFLNEKPAILGAVESFRAALAEQNVPLTVVPGSEVHLGPRLAERIETGRLMTYGDRRRHLLLECPAQAPPARIEETVFELKVAGVTPVLAHPERIRHFREQPETYLELLRLGALGQMTSSSLTGTFGPAIQALSEEWVRRGMVHLLGSDAHDARYRPPRLAEARRRWAELAGEESARRAVLDWPRALVEGGPIEPPPPRPPEKRSFWSRWFGAS